MTEQELRSKVFEYAEYFTDMEKPEPGQDGWYITWESKMDGLMALITQYGDTREREGIDRTLNLLEANLALCEWSDDISARKLWENMSEIHGLAELKEEPGDEQTNDQL